MRRKMTISIVLGAVALLGVGCGGGTGGNSSGGGEITRELLTNEWKVFGIRGNANYEGGGLEQACPETLQHLTKTNLSISCGSADEVVIRADGTATYLGLSATWSLSGSTLTVDLGNTFGVLTASVTKISVPSTDTLLRLTQVSRVVNGVRNTDEDGASITIADAPL